MFSVPPVLCSISVFGVDRVLFSVDYPFGANASGRALLDALPISPGGQGEGGGAERGAPAPADLTGSHFVSLFVFVSLSALSPPDLSDSRGRK